MAAMTNFSTSQLPVLILGGGISGLSAAWRLAERGIPVRVFESQGDIGGLAGTVREKGYCLDYGPHSFFTEDAEIFQTVRNLFSNSGLQPIPRDVKFHFRGRDIHYPFTPADILFQMGFWNSLRALISFLKPRPKPAVPEHELSVEDWALSSFGSYLYESFFKPYTEQFWKIPCSELSARSIPSHTRLSFSTTLKHLFGSIKKNPPSILDREKLPTYYPATGYGEITEKISARLLDAGGQIHCSATVTGIQNTEHGAAVSYHQNGESKTVSGSRVISTLPLPVLFDLCADVPDSIRKASSRLEYRPLLFLGMATRKLHVLPSSYMYVLDRPYNRLTEMNRFSAKTSPKGENLIAVEIPCRAGDALWNASKEDLFEHCAAALKRDHGLHRSDIHHLMLLKARYAYPVYRKDYAPHLKSVLEWIDQQPRLHTVGRGGEFRYMDADQCMRRAFDLAEKILQKEENYATH